MFTYITIAVAVVVIIALFILKSKKAPEEERVFAEKEPKKAAKKPKITLKSYSKFDHSRLVDMGLSKEEIEEYVAELILQIEGQIPHIAEAMEKSDFETMERLTHSIKGAATTIGTGGVADLLVDYNTYLKSGKDMATAKAYFGQLFDYTEKLRKQYN